MSDIVRGKVPKAPPAPADKAPDAPEAAPIAPPADVVPPPARAPATPRPPAAAAQAPKAARESRPSVAPDVAVERLFDDLVRFLDRVRALVGGGNPFPWPELGILVERVTGVLAESGELFWVANNASAPAGVDYLSVHQARVGVFTTRVGMNVGYEGPRLHALATAGCLFDVGLWQLGANLLPRLESLTPDEQALYRSHPRVSAEMIRRWAPPVAGVADAVLHHHEREKGQGFPQGLRGDAIHPDGKLVGLLDAYTTLTTPPGTRSRLRPHEAVREIVRSKHESFSPALIKALLSEISVFPPGTTVRLNTGEVGRVVAVSRSHPLRPRIELVADPKGQALRAPKVVDLRESPFLYITGAVSEGRR